MKAMTVDGHTPLDIAILNNKRAVAEYLQTVGAPARACNLDLKTNEQRTILQGDHTKRYSKCADAEGDAFFYAQQ